MSKESKGMRALRCKLCDRIIEKNMILSALSSGVSAVDFPLLSSQKYKLGRRGIDQTESSLLSSRGSGLGASND